MVLNPGTLMKLQVQWPGRIVRFLCVLCGVEVAVAELGGSCV